MTNDPGIPNPPAGTSASFKTQTFRNRKTKRKSLNRRFRSRRPFGHWVLVIPWLLGFGRWSFRVGGRDRTDFSLSRHPLLKYRWAMSVVGKSGAKEKFMDFLAQKNLRITAQRQAIVDTVFGTEEHFTAEQLLEWSRLRDRSVSRATVYRTLPLLTESGLVREMDFGKDYKFYDPNYADHPNHNHIICNDCERIVEFESDQIEKLESQISHRLGFSIKTQRLQITGSCEELKKLGACKKKSRC